LQRAAAASPYNVVAFSGVQARQGSKTTNHPGGYAVDIYLQDPKTGMFLANYAEGEEAMSLIATPLFPMSLCC